MLALAKKPAYLFRGKLCFPISPSQNEEHEKKDDQIVKILERFPDLDIESDFSFANDDDSAEYLKNAMDLCDGNRGSLQQKLDNSNPELM